MSWTLSVRPGKVLPEYWLLFPSLWRGPRGCLRSISTLGATRSVLAQHPFFSSSASSLWYGQAVVLICYILSAFCPVGNIVAKWVFQKGISYFH